MTSSVQKIALSISNIKTFPNNIPLDNETIQSFFENLIKSGAEYQDCNQTLSLLLERCSQEKCLDSLFPTISDVAQRIQDVQARRLPRNQLVESIH